MRVLVTGHKGYIGTVLVRMLLEEGHEVVGLDSNLFRACTFGDDMVEVPEIVTDIRDVERTHVEGYDAVLHLAGLSNDPLGDLDPQLTNEINHEATVRLGHLAKEAGVRRLVFSSSCSTYGASGDDLVTEEARLNPVTPYGESKVAAERGLAQLACDHFSPVFLRSATAYGVSPRLRFDLVLNNLVAWAHTTGEVHLKSDGSPWRPIVHIEDIARAFIAVLHAPRERIHNQAFNVGRTSENYRIGELAGIVQDTVPGSRVGFADGASPDKRCYRVDCSKIQAAIPTFRPRWNARSGARQLYDAYRTVGVGREDFEGPRYSRIAHIRQVLESGAMDESLRWRGDARDDTRGGRDRGRRAVHVQVV